MAIITPLRGIRYNPSKIKSFSEIITPPYDVISPEQQKKYYKKNAYNLIRLEYGIEYPGDNEYSNRYTRAANTFKQWIREEVLIQEKEPVFYWYEQSFKNEGRLYRRCGLIASLKLEPYESRAVIPHEATLSKPKADRLKLLNHTNANFSPIFGLYSDPEQKIEEECSVVARDEPEVNFVDEEGHEHRLWLIPDRLLCEKIQQYFIDRSIFLADGHHRYETALAYAREMSFRGYEGYDTVLSVLVNMFSPGLLILPTHRILTGLPSFRLSDFMAKLKRDFYISDSGPADKSNIHRITSELKEQSRDTFSFGACTAERLFNIRLKGTYPREERPLDVNLLQKMVLENVLGLTHNDLQEGNHVIYSQDEEEALSLVKSGEAQVSFLLSPPHMKQIVATAHKGSRLPQKSTFFYPKLISGLVINKLGQASPVK